jgi:2-succinyl-5-enolpyruvyl-6-hydroxy-3-cyclohexene-1-carboxylate synthase
MQSADVTASFCASLVDEWIALGVRYAMLAPGSRSTPMAMALSNADLLHLSVFHDERSAAFAALGAAKTTGLPTLVLCTSGTAAVNFHPAVVEASHAEVPMIVLTADRPPELQGLGAPQTIDQKYLYGSAVRTFIDAGVPDDDRRDEWRNIARRAFQNAVTSRPGPVHVNLPFREPLVGSAQMVASRQPFDISNTPRVVGTEVLSRVVGRLRGKRGVIIAGERGAECDDLMKLAAQLRWPVLADPLGGCRGESVSLIRHADAWLRDSVLAGAFEPQAVLRFGTLPASKVVNGWLRDAAAESTTVTQSPFLVDPDRRTTMHVVADPHLLCRDLAAIVEPVDEAWIRMWTDAESAARGVIARQLDSEHELTEPGVARTTVSAMPTGSQLVVSSSMPIRDVEWYAGSADHFEILANRGANGIDGVVSTAVGVAIASGKPTGLLIGDIAFLHDANGLIGLARRDIDLRIVVVDNAGGGIFSFLPQRSLMQNENFERLFGTPHGSNLAMLAQAHGLRVVVARDTQGLRSALVQHGPSVVLVQSDRDRNVSQHDQIHREVVAAVRTACDVR